MVDTLAPFVLVPHSVEFTPTGLVFHQPVDYEDWIKLGRGLHSLERCIHWAIGDWLVYGEHVFGEKYAQAEAETGFSIETLKRDQWVASRFPIVARHSDLSFSHHVAVAALPETARCTLLAKAAEHEMSSRELREIVRVYKIEDATNPVVDPKVADAVIAAYHPPPLRQYKYRAWYITKVDERDTSACQRCGEDGTNDDGTLAPDVHLIRLERESIPTEEEIAAHERRLKELNADTPKARASRVRDGLAEDELYDYPPETERQSRVLCSRCVWEATE